MKEYFELYCKKFDLDKHINLNHEVTMISELDEQTGWRITTKSSEGHKMWLFDKVVVAIGRHISPIWPEIEGIDKFKGTIIHASAYIIDLWALVDGRYKRPEEFAGKTVLVVGSGNSGLDCAVEMARDVAKQVYISGRGILVYLPSARSSVRQFLMVVSLA